MKKIIGIFLVQNEERFIEQAVLNVLDFCDHLILVDHQSLDQTLSILQRLGDLYPEKISLHQIQNSKESHQLLQPFVGTDTWVFGIDGDELYDPKGLISFRYRILSGEFNEEWMVLGNVLHVDALFENSTAEAHSAVAPILASSNVNDTLSRCMKEAQGTAPSTANLERGLRNQQFHFASGYFSPPSRSITKLYNFAAITAWNGKTVERLHGGDPQFRTGFHEQKKRLLQYEYSWEESPLRCLHLCFLKRSSVELAEQRQNIMEINAGRRMGFFKRIARALFRLPEPASWKEQHYQRGERYVIDATPFF